jgi:hypothetical protein
MVARGRDDRRQQIDAEREEPEADEGE